jgi:hypothetical protein
MEGMSSLRTRIIGLAITAAIITALAVPASSGAYQTGVGDNNPKMFSDPNYKALHVKIARYIAPYNVADGGFDMYVARNWVADAEAAGIQPLIAFYHSRAHGTHLPSVAAYTKEIKKFMKAFPEIHNYQPWNEANRGFVREGGGGSFASPSAKQSAQYYLALRKACSRCTVVGLDVLDSQNIGATINYVNSFKRYVGASHMPHLWGLHNYTDTNRNRSTGTKAVLADVPGQIWLTETGGIVKFGGAFPYSTKRAATALKYMFKLAKSNPRITRLYIFNWYGGASSVQRFDAGLMTATGTPRPGYFVVRKQLTGH